MKKLGYGKTVKEVETDKTKAKVRSSQTNQTEKKEYQILSFKEGMNPLTVKAS